MRHARTPFRPQPCHNPGHISYVPTLALCFTLLATTGLIAAYLPARRTSRLDPMPVLRSEERQAQGMAVIFRAGWKRRLSRGCFFVFASTLAAPPGSELQKTDRSVVGNTPPGS